MVKHMIKWISSWRQMYKEISNLKWKDFSVIFAVIVIMGALITIPYAIIFYNMAYIYSAVMWPIHLAIWLIPIYGNLCLTLHAKLVYDIAITKIPTLAPRKEVILGALFNPYTLGFLIVISICLEILF